MAAPAPDSIRVVWPPPGACDFPDQVQVFRRDLNHQVLLPSHWTAVRRTRRGSSGFLAPGWSPPFAATDCEPVDGERPKAYGQSGSCHGGKNSSSISRSSTGGLLAAA